MWGLIQTSRLSVKKEGMEQLARRRKRIERRRNGGNCDFDTLNSGVISMWLCSAGVYSLDLWMHIASLPQPYPHLSSSCLSIIPKTTFHSNHPILLLFHSVSPAFLAPSSFYIVMLIGTEALESPNQNKLSWIITSTNKWNVRLLLVGATWMIAYAWLHVLEADINLNLCKISGYHSAGL